MPENYNAEKVRVEVGICVHVEYLFVPVRHPTSLSIERFATLALQKNEPHFDMLPLRFPSYDRDHSSVTFLSQLLNFG